MIEINRNIQNKLIKYSQMKNFTIKNEIIDILKIFKYLGIYVESNNYYWTSFMYNIKKDRKSWMRVENILLCEKF